MKYPPLNKMRPGTENKGNKQTLTLSQCFIKNKDTSVPESFKNFEKTVSRELINSYLSVKYRWQVLLNALIRCTSVRALTFD